MDYDNGILPLGKNTILYGHNMKNRSMFHSLRYYVDNSFANTHRFVYLKTLYEYTKWEVFSFYKTDTRFNYIQTQFASVGSFFDLAQKMKSKTIYDFGVDINRNDRILTLSTCTNLADDSRYVLHAKLVENSRKQMDIQITQALDASLWDLADDWQDGGEWDGLDALEILEIQSALEAAALQTD